MWIEKQKITSYRHYREKAVQLEFWNQSDHSEWYRMAGLILKWLGNVGLIKAMLVCVHGSTLHLCIVFCALPCSAGYQDKCMPLYEMKVYTCTCITCHSKIFLLLQSTEFKYNKPQFLEKAKEWTQKYATSNKVTATSVKVLLKMF